MGTDEQADPFERVPDWWVEPVLGMFVTVVTLVGVVLVTRGVSTASEALFGTAGPVQGITSVSLPAYGLTMAGLAVLYAAVGLGVPYVYLTYRGFDPGFAVTRPDGEAARLLAGLAALAPVLVGAGTLALEALDGTPGWEVPYAYLPNATVVGGPSVSSSPLWLTAALTIPVLAAVGGPVAGAVFHGVLQHSLQRVASAAVAVGATVLLTVGAVGATDPVDAAVLGTFVAATAYAYERTGNLAVPMAAYALLNAVTLTLAVLLILRASGTL